MREFDTGIRFAPPTEKGGGGGGGKDKNTGHGLKAVICSVSGFLGDIQPPDYSDIVTDNLQQFRELVDRQEEERS